jgi:hypothetical protein
MTVLAIAAAVIGNAKPSFFRQILDDWPQDKGDERHDDDDSDADQKYPHKLPFVVFRFLMTSLTNDTLADRGAGRNLTRWLILSTAADNENAAAILFAVRAASIILDVTVLETRIKGHLSKAGLRDSVTASIPRAVQARLCRRSGNGGRPVAPRHPEARRLRKPTDKEALQWQRPT